MSAGKKGGYSPVEVALIMFHDLNGSLQAHQEAIIRQWIARRKILALRDRLYAALTGLGVSW